MNPPKKQPGELVSKTGPISTRLRIIYGLLDVLQRPFGFTFWRIEQAKAWIHDRTANVASGQ
jgi:hypothetical protein